MLFKNVASQKALVFAYNKTTGIAQTGDAANITASVSKDGAAPVASNDVNPTEIGGGWYAFDLTQAETNCDLFLLYATSATSNILVSSVSGYTTGGAIPRAGVASQASVDTVDDFIDTEVAAIKARTDLIPASPAATGDIPTAAQIADKVLGRNIAGGSDGGRTVTSALRPLRNKVSRSGAVLTVTQEDDATEAWTAAITTSANADPIVTVDPA